MTLGPSHPTVIVEFACTLLLPALIIAVSIIIQEKADICFTIFQVVEGLLDPGIAVRVCISYLKLYRYRSQCLVVTCYK